MRSGHAIAKCGRLTSSDVSSSRANPADDNGSGDFRADTGTHLTLTGGRMTNFSGSDLTKDDVGRTEITYN